MWRVHGTGGQPQSELERVAERTVAEGQCIVDGQRSEPDGRRPGKCFGKKPKRLVAESA